MGSSWRGLLLNLERAPVENLIGLDDAPSISLCAAKQMIYSHDIHRRSYALSESRRPDRVVFIGSWTALLSEGSSEAMRLKNTTGAVFMRPDV